MKITKALFFALFALCLSACKCKKCIRISPSLTQIQDKQVLNVADFMVLNEFEEPRASQVNVFPTSILPEVQKWAQGLFVLNGQSGKAVLRIIDARASEDKETSHDTLASTMLGINIIVVLEFKGVSTYESGKVEARVSREINIIKEDLTPLTRQKIWKSLIEEELNVLRQQLMQALQKSFPNILIATNQFPPV